MSQSSKKIWSWPLLVLSTVGIAIAAACWLLVTTVGESKRVEQALIDRFGWAHEYTPTADGQISAASAEAFIRVRRAIQPACDDYQGILDALIGLEALETDTEMPPGEKASEGLGQFKSLFRAAPVMLAFMDARNGALLAEEMGLGEYLYLYLAAYGESLAGERESSYSEMEDAYISDRAKSEFIRILTNQSAALESAGQQAQLPTEIRHEIEALESGLHPSPWPQGPPEPIRASLAPYQQTLDELYCSGIVRIELLQKNRGLNFGG